jgi:hypothetical protein
MRICDLTEEQIYVGMRIKSFISDKRATIVEHDTTRNSYWWILWDGDTNPFSGFWWNHCECEVIEE